MPISIENRFRISTESLQLTLSDGYPHQKDIISIYDHLVQIVGDDQEALGLWMHQPQKRLGDKTPSTLLQDEAGLTAILHCLRKELEMDSLIG